MLNLIREEMEKSQEHELKLVQLMHNSVSKTGFFTNQQGSASIYQTIPQPVNMPCTEEQHMPGSYSPQLYGGYGLRAANHTQNTSNSFFGGNLYEILVHISKWICVFHSLKWHLVYQ